MLNGIQMETALNGVLQEYNMEESNEANCIRNFIAGLYYTSPALLEDEAIGLMKEFCTKGTLSLRGKLC